MALKQSRDRVDLLFEAATGGHTISEHVGKDEALLRKRLASQRGVPACSTFVNIGEAEDVVGEVLSARAADVQVWLLGAGPRGAHAVMSLVHDVGRPVGLLALRATGRVHATSKVRVALRKTTRAAKGYFVLTAFPVP
jgi:hypothetical protein